MNTAIRFAIGALSIFGALALSNELNDTNVSLMNAFVLSLISQVVLSMIGTIIFMIASQFKHDDLKEHVGIDEDIDLPTYDQGDFEIKEIITDNFKVIGNFEGKPIYEGVKVIFDNGYEAQYKFENVIRCNDIESMDVSDLTPGSLILQPGVIYVPIQ